MACVAAVRCRASTEGLGRTLFERLAGLGHGEALVRMLSVQYRMSSEICSWASAAMYEGALVPGEGVGERLLSDLLPPPAPPGLEEDKEEKELLSTALVLIDTAGCPGFAETTTAAGKDNDGNGNSGPTRGADGGDSGGSKSNIGEAELVAVYLDELLAAMRCSNPCHETTEIKSATVDGGGISDDRDAAIISNDSGSSSNSSTSRFSLAEVGVIAPYNAQVALLRERLTPYCEAGLEVSTVDGFQGR